MKRIQIFQFVSKTLMEETPLLKNKRYHIGKIHHIYLYIFSYVYILFSNIIEESKTNRNECTIHTDNISLTSN